MKYFPRTLLSFLVLGFLLTLASIASSAQDRLKNFPNLVLLSRNRK